MEKLESTSKTNGFMRFVYPAGFLDKLLVAIKRDWMRVPNFKFRSVRQGGVEAVAVRCYQKSRV